MSDSAITKESPSPAFLAHYHANLAKAQKELDRATALAGCIEAKPLQPSTLYPSGYCADGFMAFESKADGPALLDILRQYPPEPVVRLLETQSMKPAAAIRGQEVDDLAIPLFPVLFKSEKRDEASIRRNPQRQLPPGEARWWTRQGGYNLELKVTGVQFSDLEGLVNSVGPHELYGVNYATGYQAGWCRPLVSYPGEFIYPELVKCHAEWKDYLDTRFAGRPGARSWAQAVASMARHSPHLTLQQLKSSAFRFNSALDPKGTILSDDERLEAWERALARVAAEDAMREPLDAAVDATFNAAEAFVTRMLSPFSLKVPATYREPPNWFQAALQQHVSKEIGKGLVVAWLTRDPRGASCRIQVDSALHEGGKAFRDFVVAGTSDGPRLTAAALAPEFVPEGPMPWA